MTKIQNLNKNLKNSKISWKTLVARILDTYSYLWSYNGSYKKSSIITQQLANQGSPQGGFPPETGKIVVEKWGYFPELDKMTKVVEDGIENG